MTSQAVERADRLQQAYRRIATELKKSIVGQDEVVQQLLIAIFVRGHCLLEGVPGLGKTLLVSSIADTMSLEFKRIQFTPDLMPSDITGTEVLEKGADGSVEFKPRFGPIFSNIVLADEINRTPPKTQAALLEAMQERQVTIGRVTEPLPEPFFVLATQNPIEQEGTYPLPEAQLDRFLFKIVVDYPAEHEEIDIMKQAVARKSAPLSRILSAADILAHQDLVREMPVPDAIYHYALRLVRGTRPSEDVAPSEVRDAIEWGAGPRASIFLVSAAQANAVMAGRYHVGPEDIRAIALPILRHRIGLRFEAIASGQTPDKLVKTLLDKIDV